MPAQVIINKKSQLAISIIVAATLLVSIVLGVWAYEEKLPEGVASRAALEARINKCISLSANEIFTKFGKSGFVWRGSIPVQIGNIVENVPLNDLTPDATSLANYFTASITNLTRICVAKIDFKQMNAILLNNPDSIVVTFIYDKKMKMSNITLNTTLVFGTGNRTTIKLTNTTDTQYPFAFNDYANVMTKIEEHLFADYTYYLTNGCEIYNINGKTNITILPVGTKHTYIEVVDVTPLDYNYKEPYVWREVVAVKSANPGFCMSR